MASVSPVESKTPLTYSSIPRWAELKERYNRLELKKTEGTGFQEEYKQVVSAKRLLDESKQKLDERVQRGDGTRVGRRYRRREKGEVEQLTELETQQRALRAEREETRKKEEFAAEVEQLRKDVTIYEEGHRKALTLMEAKMKSLSVTEDAETYTRKSKEIDDELAKLAEDMKQLQETAEKEWKSKNTPVPDRSITELFGDIMKCAHWMTDPRGGQSSSDTIQRLERIQQQIERKELPDTHEYAPATAYALYSDSRKCPILLTQIGKFPAKWDYKYYYQPTPLEEVQRIFKQCNGRSVEALTGTVDRSAFADVIIGSFAHMAAETKDKKFQGRRVTQEKIPPSFCTYLIGVGGRRQAGKDTFVEFILKTSSIPWRRMTFSHKLRICVSLLTKGRIRYEDTLTFEQKCRTISTNILWTTLGEAIATLNETFAWTEMAPTRATWVAALNRFYECKAVSEDMKDDAKIDTIKEISIGRLLQLVGTELGRDVFGKNLWVDYLFNTWKAHGCPPTLISDARFDNEWEQIVAAGGLTVLVNADIRLSTATHVGMDGRSSTHASEVVRAESKFDMVLLNNGTKDEFYQMIARYHSWKFMLHPMLVPAADKKLVYITGPMSGKKDFNIAAFHEAEEKLTAAGFAVINPHKVNPPDDHGSWVACLKRDISILTHCDHIYQLPGWETSKGAQLEYQVAHSLGLSPVTLT